jgi:hypothetical protein
MERAGRCAGPAWDWSMRRQHLAGIFGAALLERIYALKWARRARDSRAVIFTPDGEAKFKRLFSVAAA